MNVNQSVILSREFYAFGNLTWQCGNLSQPNIRFTLSPHLLNLSREKRRTNVKKTKFKIFLPTRPKPLLQWRLYPQAHLGLIALMADLHWKKKNVKNSETALYKHPLNKDSMVCPLGVRIRAKKKAKTFFASIEKTFLVCTFCFPITDRVTVPQRTVSFNCRPVHVHPTCICIHDNEKRKGKFPREYHVVRIGKTKHAAKEVYSKNIWV